MSIRQAVLVFQPLCSDTVHSDSCQKEQDLYPAMSRLTGRKAEISYEFDNMHIKIPSGTGPSAEHAEWVLHGTMKIRTRDTGTSPN